MIVAMETKQKIVFKMAHILLRYQTINASGYSYKTKDYPDYWEIYIKLYQPRIVILQVSYIALPPK